MSVTARRLTGDSTAADMVASESLAPTIHHGSTLRSLQHIPYAIDSWCPVARSRSLKRGMVLRTQLLNKAVALFRDESGVVHALEDRCPHRGVALSMGRVCKGAVQCAYHGWMIDGTGCARGASGPTAGAVTPRTGCFPARESHGLVWLFLGGVAAARAPAREPPALEAASAGPSLDILLDMPVRAHWSLMLDNGLDLFHQHLHRDIPFFFRIDRLERYGADGTRFTARYRAQLADNLGRRRPGNIEISVDRNVAALRFNDDLVIYGIATPRSADGREITMWWLLRKSAPGLRGLVLHALRYFIGRLLERGFRQDRRVLESEQRAIDDGFQVTCEPNPIISALHEHVERNIVSEAIAKSVELRTLPEGYPPERLARRAFVGSVERGTTAVISLSHKAIIRHDQLHEVLPPSSEWIEFYRYGHFAVLP